MMHSLTKPSYIFEEVFENCVTSRRDPFKTQLLAKKSAISSAVLNYDHKMIALEGHNIQTIINKISDPILNDELKKLYSDKIVSGTSRKIYDEILVQSMLKGCCFCSYEDSAELDHFLPKATFSEFSVAPINLVPVCHRCNKAKSEHSPESIETSFIHPYYETCTEDILWLGAAISFINNSPSIQYFILGNVEQPLKERLEYQFKKLNLAERYSSQAARELTGRENRWRKAYSQGGTEEVKTDLREENDSEKSNNKNSWKSALYTCLLQNDQFCKMNWSI